MQGDSLKTTAWKNAFRTTIGSRPSRCCVAGNYAQQKKLRKNNLSCRFLRFGSKIATAFGQSPSPFKIVENKINTTSKPLEKPTSMSKYKDNIQFTIYRQKKKAIALPFSSPKTSSPKKLTYSWTLTGPILNKNIIQFLTTTDQKELTLSNIKSACKIQLNNMHKTTKAASSSCSPNRAGILISKQLNPIIREPFSIG